MLRRKRPAPIKVQKICAIMLHELFDNKLEVVLVPSRVQEGGLIRTVQWRNPEWYREMCSWSLRASRKKDKHRTTIKRRTTCSILERIASGKPVLHGIYYTRLMDAITYRKGGKSRG
jgi:hypothetical protein